MFKYYLNLYKFRFALGENLSSAEVNKQETDNKTNQLDLSFLSPEDSEKAQFLLNELDNVNFSKEYVTTQANTLKNGLEEFGDPRDKEFKEITEKITQLIERIKKYGEEANELNKELNLYLEKCDKTIETIKNIDISKTSAIEFFNLDSSQRLKYITSPSIEQSKVASGEEKNLEFNFTFDGKFNKELYLGTTAGSVLPSEVGNVVFGGEQYFRSGVSGEFFNEIGERLIIKDGTQIQVGDLRDAESLKDLQELNNSKVLDYLNNHPGVNKNIVLESVNRGLDIDFCIEAFSSLGNNKGELENAFIEIDRIRGAKKLNLEQTDGKYSPELAFYVLSKFNNDWQTKALNIGYSKDEIDYYMSDGEINLSLDSDKISNSDSLENGEYLKGNKLLNNPEFGNKLQEICKNLGANPIDLVKLMKAESSLDPRIVNSQTKATGLIQFMPSTAKDLGTTIGKIRGMSAVEQLDLVQEYFLKNSGGEKLDSLTKLYQVVFFPASLGKDSNWLFESRNLSAEKISSQNPGISKYSTRSDGLIDLNCFQNYINNHVDNLV